ncbi:MAG: amidohydrolase family protein, partial [Bacillota bacterium]
MKLIQNVHVFAPKDIGIQDILIGEGKILNIGKNIKCGNLDVETIDGSSLIATPGFIDGHVHITGGGGEAGYQSRINPISKADLLAGGVTTVLGLLGTDGYTRSMKDLIAKAKGLKAEGISTYLFTGSYQIPVRTLFSTIEDDMLFTTEIIGTGEIAIADHRSSQVTVNDLRDVIAKTHVAGLLSNKAGVTVIHLGKEPNGIKMIIDALDNTGIPIEKVLPTHANRNQAILDDAINYHHSHGLYFDITAT